MFVVVAFRGHVHDAAFSIADAHPTVVHAGRNAHEAGQVLAEVNLVHFAARLGIVAGIVKRDLHCTAQAIEVVGLQAMKVPRLHHSGIRRREIDLTELFKPRVVGAHDFAKATAFVWQDASATGAHAVDQLFAAANEQRFIGEDGP